MRVSRLRPAHSAQVHRLSRLSGGAPIAHAGMSPVADWRRPPATSRRPALVAACTCRTSAAGTGPNDCPAMSWACSRVLAFHAVAPALDGEPIVPDMLHAPVIDAAHADLRSEVAARPELPRESFTSCAEHATPWSCSGALGHANLTTTMRDAHLAPDQLRKVSKLRSSIH
jgi:hypothetical protein